ncbi:MAG: serine hydrolase [Bacteroidetes bacterium]|nr:serine hydrolase [Bacteroidota bacterium]
MKRSWWKVLVGVLLVTTAVLWFSGKLYYIKALTYNYVNIDDLNLFHVRTVEAGKPQPWNIATDYNKKALTPELRKALEQYRTVAFLVVQNDSIRYEEYWDNYDASSLSNSFSMAKSIISILIGIAHDEGKIKSLDQTACEYLPDFCSPENKVVTIRQLLMMSSGLNDDEGYASLTSPVTRSYYDTDLRKQMMELRVVTKPGVSFNYMSANTQLLGFILEKATGKSISEYASEKLWQPIGAEHDAKWSLDHKDGTEKAYCCFYSNARDFARIGKLFLNKGMWNGKQVISEAYVNAAISPASISDGDAPNTIYGYQWWLTDYMGTPVFYARGILGQYIFVLPSKQLIFVRLGHERGEKDANGELLDVPVYLSEVMKLYGENL